MRAWFEIKNPDEVTCRLTIDMSLEKWKDLRGALRASGSSFLPIESTIQELINVAEKSFCKLSDSSEII